MNVDLQNLLTTRADSVDPPTFDSSAVVAHGERLVRRRIRLVAAGAALAVALTGGTSALLLELGSDRTAPSERPPSVVPPWTPGTRPVTYGQEQTLHLGERQIATGLDFLSLDVTDDGAALTTLDGRIWFTDGSSIDRIGTTLGGRKDDSGGVGWQMHRPKEWVVSDTRGSLLAWLEFHNQRAGRPELVVYDSASRTVLARKPVDIPRGGVALVVTIVDREVFLVTTSNARNARRSLLSYDVDSGELGAVDAATVEAARRDEPRALVVGPSVDDGKLLSWEQTGDDLTTTGVLTVRDSELEGLFDPGTGERVVLRVPLAERVGLPDRLWFVQWIDDDRFTAFFLRPVSTGDLLVCRISAGRCDIAVDASTWTTPPVLPGEGGVGSELAQMVAK